jgi:pimeloyl-ACP methyl ester carboxylesterase
MKKISKTLLAGIVGVATALSGCTPPQSQQPPVKNIVLVHGAFADGTSWAKVIPILEARGFHVVAVQNPLTSLSGDVDATRRIIAMQDGPVILVGHSWGGAVITEVGDDPKVAGLVYVAAYVPDVGMSANDTSKPFGATPGQKAIQVNSEKFAWMSEEGILNSFANGLPMAERRLVLAVQGQIYGPMFEEKLTHAAWKSKPSWHRPGKFRQSEDDSGCLDAPFFNLQAPLLPDTHRVGCRAVAFRLQTSYDLDREAARQERQHEPLRPEGAEAAPGKRAFAS